MVGGTDESDARWFADSFTGSDVGPFLDLSAPAHHIFVANGTDPSHPYAFGSGTSFAAPYAASAAALALSINPNLTASQVRNLLFDTAFNPDNPHPGAPFWDQDFGWGRVDFGALAAAAATVPEPGSLGLLAVGGIMLLRARKSKRVRQPMND
jgi:subtilisin family serine protease